MSSPRLSLSRCSRSLDCNLRRPPIHQSRRSNATPRFLPSSVWRSKQQRIIDSLEAKLDFLALAVLAIFIIGLCGRPQGLARDSCRAPHSVTPSPATTYSTGPINFVRSAFRAIEAFFRLMVGDTSMVKRPDLSPLDHVPTVDELQHGARRT